MATETRIITGKGKIGQRFGRKRIRIDLPPQLERIAQIAITAKGLGKPMASNRVYYGMALGTQEKNDPSVLSSGFPQGLSANKCLGKRVQALDVFELFGNDAVPRDTANSHKALKLFYAHPVRWGLAHFVINDQSGVREGGFMPPVISNLVDTETGAREAYFIYESVNKGIVGIVNVAFSEPSKGLFLNRPPSNSSSQ